MTITPEKEIYVATQKAIEEVGVDEFKHTSMFRDGRKHTFITPEEVARLAAAATSGTWRWQDEEECLVGDYQIVMRRDHRGRMTFANYPDGTDEANAAFIAAAHDMAALIERQDRLLKLADDLAEAIADNAWRTDQEKAALIAYSTTRGQK